MTDDELTEAIAGKICDPPRHVHQWPLAGVDAYCGQCWTRAAAVLPIVAVEVRKAQAEALREAALDVSFIEIEDDYDRLDYSTSREFYEDMVRDWLRACAIATETGDSDEHR